MHTLRFDVMQADRYVCTLSYKFFPAFTIAAADLREFAIKQRPSLRGQEFNIIINNSTKLQRNFNEIPRNFNETSTRSKRFSTRSKRGTFCNPYEQ